jgi:hypothetical protein
MKEVGTLAEINMLKFGETSKNTIVAVQGDVKTTKKFHQLQCHTLYVGRKKGFNHLSPVRGIRTQSDWCFEYGGHVHLPHRSGPQIPLRHLLQVHQDGHRQPAGRVARTPCADSPALQRVVPDHLPLLSHPSLAVTIKHGTRLLFEHERRRAPSYTGPQALRTVTKYGGAELVELLGYSKRKRQPTVMTKLHDTHHHEE